MKFTSSTLCILAAIITTATADLHWNMQCVDSFGKGGSVKDGSVKINDNATHCACRHYKHRNTGRKKWDSCPDCNYDGLTCSSPNGHLGGDEFTYYCEKICGATGGSIS